MLSGWRPCPVCGEPTRMGDEEARRDHAALAELEAQGRAPLFLAA